MIHVINPRFKVPEGIEVINTTSRSFTWSRGLSPFFAGPVTLYGGYVAQNVENAWQFSKVYYNHVDADENPTDAYFEWASKGWADQKAHRYPAGKGNKPLFSYWDGDKLSYVEARRRIYIPLYSAAVRPTVAFARLRFEYDEANRYGRDIYLWDFDAHNLTPGTFSYWELFDNPKIKVGHAYVLAMMLEGII